MANRPIRKRQTLADEAARLKQAMGLNKPASQASEDEMLCATFDSMSADEQERFLRFLNELEL